MTWGSLPLNDTPESGFLLNALNALKIESIVQLKNGDPDRIPVLLVRLIIRSKTQRPQAAVLPLAGLEQLPFRSQLTSRCDSGKAL